jgi:hypothetical protein
MYFPASPTNTADDNSTKVSDYDVFENRFVSFCDRFRYLGTLIAPSLEDDVDINHRINSARGAFFSKMRNIFKDHRINRDLRVQLYKQIVVNIVLWGCETWALTEKHRSLLNRFHHDCARALYGITRWHHQHLGIRIADVLADLNLEPIQETIRHRRLAFLEKIARKPNEDKVKRVLFSQAAPPGKMKSGRRKMSTCTSLVNDLKDAGYLRPGKDDNDGKLEKWFWTSHVGKRVINSY